MKTPKRPLEIAPFEFDNRIAPEYISMQRWKRKNRLRQLKATIARQKKEYESLWESFSHMSKRCCQLLYPTDETND